MAYYDDDMYPVQFSVDYPEGPRNRLTALLRIILAIPIILVVVFLRLIVIPTLFMILFRKKYPRWWFDFNLQLLRFNARVDSYIALLRDEYPATDDEQGVQLEIAYPAPEQLNRIMPLIKWLLAIPHYIILLVLGIISLVVVFIAWLAILITGRYPRGLFDFVVGALRWENRVTAYAFALTTDRYPPFRLSE